MHLSWGLSWKGKVRVWQVFSRHNRSHAGEQDQKHFPLRGNKLLFCHLVEKTAIKEFITLPLFGLFSISCTVPFSDGVIYIVTGPLSEGFMPVVWISKLVILLTKEDMSLTVLYYCIFNCAHRCHSFKTVFKSLIFICLILLFQGQVACQNFTLKTGPYLKQDITT